MSNLAINWRGEYAPYDKPEDWLPALEKSRLSPWLLGQMIFARHNEGIFRTRAAERTISAGSTVQLNVEGITPLASMAILSGRLDGDPFDLFGKVIVPYAEELDAIIGIPPDAHGGTYVFLAQQWKPGGQLAYPGGSSIYPSSATSVEVRTHVADRSFWESYQPWSRKDAEEVRENIRLSRENI